MVKTDDSRSGKTVKPGHFFVIGGKISVFLFFYCHLLNYNFPENTESSRSGKVSVGLLSLSSHTTERAVRHTAV